MQHCSVILTYRTEDEDDCFCGCERASMYAEGEVWKLADGKGTIQGVRVVVRSAWKDVEM